MNEVAALTEFPARKNTFLLACFCLFTVCAPLYGQEVTAAITGKVIDPSGAVISGAKVAATDTQRGTVWDTETNADGVYNLPRVPIGTYDVKVTAPGFQTAVQSGIHLQLNQAARVDLQMSVGSVSETIEVNALPPLLQTETTQLSTVLDSHTNEALPLATRNYVQLTLLSPGSVHPDPSSFKNGQSTGSGGRPYINGNREQSNNFLLDGADNNQVSDNVVGYTPSVDAIAEFNMITQNASAEFGNFQGGIVSVSTKSGTNSFHGDAFEFFRNDVLNANDWASKWNGNPRAAIRWNMFGGAVGGPIKRDKLFFFADYQGERFDTPTSVGSISVFTAAERRGDFSALYDTNQTGASKPIQLYNPFSVTNGQRTPFPNNQIPISLLDPVAANLFSSQYYPLPINGNLRNNQLNATRAATNADQGDAKIDWNISDKDRMFGRYSQSQDSRPSSNSFPLFFGSFFDVPTHSGVLDWTRTVSPSLVNEARVAVNYTVLHNGGTDNGLGNIAEDLGIADGNDRGPGLLSLGGFGIASGLGSSNIGTQQLFADTVIQYEDAIVWTKGTHAMHMGFQGWRQRINTFYAGNNGRTGFINFDGRFTAGPSVTAVADAGIGLADADFFLGLPVDIGRGVNTGTWGQRANIFSAYFQDNWRVTSNLTLNLGLRYETHTPWVEVKDRQTNFGMITGSIETAGQSKLYSNNRALYNNYNGGLDFQPRIGLAWTPGGGKTVIRAAYTLSSYLEGTGTNLRLPLNPPLNEEFETRYDTGGFTLPGSRTGQGLTILSSPGDPFAGANIRLWNPDIQPAASQQWNFSVQRQFNQSTTLQAGYVGQKGTHLMVPMPYFQRQLNPDGTTSPSPFLSGNPALAKITQISGTESNGNMSYNALQATLQKRLGGGLQAQVAYTYSKCMTDSSGYYGSWGGQTTPTSPYWQNLYDKKAEWGPCYYDVTHTLTAYATYELPLGRDRKFGKSMPRVVNAVVGDWQVSGILSLHGGFPLTISGPDNSNTSSRGARADCIAPAHVFGKRNSPVGGFQWFDPDSYAAPANGTFGSCGVATVRGPGLHSFDMSLQKEFPFTERQRLELRGEFINLTNTPILNSPGSGLGSGLGLLQSSQGARNVQIGLKYYF